MTAPKDLMRRLEEIEIVIKKGTKGIWYAHPYEKQVRTGFMRWLHVTEVELQYQKHVASVEDEAHAIALALNEMSGLITTLRQALVENQTLREALGALVEEMPVFLDYDQKIYFPEAREKLAKAQALLADLKGDG